MVLFIGRDLVLFEELELDVDPRIKRQSPLMASVSQDC